MKMDDKCFCREQRKIRKNCRILYPNARPAWACGAGWIWPLAKLSYRLETLNMLFKRRFNVYIEAEQIKEKFGTLRFYFLVKAGMRAAPDALSRALVKFKDLVYKKVNFKYKYIVKTPARLVKTCIEAPSDNPLPPKPGEVSVPSSSGNSNYIYSEYRKFEVKNPVPTKNRLLYMLIQACSAVDRILCSIFITNNRRQIIAQQCLDDIADELVRKTEDECYSTCEICGAQIGNSYSARCSTVGWIRYLCEKCARESGPYYIKGQAKYDKNGVKICDIQRDEYEDEM